MLMLQSISWTTYLAALLFTSTIYYLYVGLAFYRKELKDRFHRLTGQQANIKRRGEPVFPDQDVMGKALPDDMLVQACEDISFGPDENEPEALLPDETENGQYYAAMEAEVKTMLRVIEQSGEGKDNFEMLFRLIAEKYHVLYATPYQQKINELLLQTSLPFPISLEELNNYWITNQN